MIVVDTSALMAVVLNEEMGESCSEVLAAEAELLISAVTVAEALIVSDGRNVSVEMNRLIDGLGFDIAPTTGAAARRVAEIYRKWGKGHHPAALNFGDCFAYDLAKTFACPLLYVGKDFGKTDIKSAL